MARTCASVRDILLLRASMTTKSLPSPCIFRNGMVMMRGYMAIPPLKSMGAVHACAHGCHGEISSSPGTPPRHEGADLAVQAFRLFRQLTSFRQHLMGDPARLVRRFGDAG